MMGHQHAVAVVVVAAIMHDMRRRVVLGGRIGYRVEVAIVVDTIKKFLSCMVHVAWCVSRWSWSEDN